MNYDAFMEPITWFLTGMEKHSDDRRDDLYGNAGAFQDVMHMVVTALVVLLSIVSLSVIVSAGLKDKSCRFYGVCAAIALGMMIIGAMGMKIVPAQYFGVVERFSVFAATGFNAALGIHLFCMKDEGVK